MAATGVKYLAIAHDGNGATGTNTLVAAPSTGQRIAVLGWCFTETAHGAAFFTLQDTGGAVKHTGVMALDPNGGNLVFPPVRSIGSGGTGYFLVTAGTGLDVVVGTGDISGWLIYEVI